MFTVIKILFVLASLALLPGPSTAVLNDRPRMRCDAGHLFLEGGPGKNISLVTKGRGAVVINGLDIAGSISLMSAVRPQLESLNNTDLGYLVRNLSRVAQTVASQQWISSSIEGLKTNASRSRGNLATLRNDVTSIQSTLRARLDPLVANVSQLSTQVGLITPEGGQRLQQINTVIQNLQQASTEAASARQDLTERVIPGLRQDVTQLQTGIVGLPQLRDRIEALEAQFNGSDISGSSEIVSASDSSTIRKMKRNLRRLNARLQMNECASGPCRNGGTCIDGYMSYTCLCRNGWAGENCDDDINECYMFFGTDLGCQNGATCTNTQGGYTCQCPAGWYGVHCTLKTDSCTASSGSSLCGPHGVCINTPRRGHAFSCMCDEGWTPGNSTPACVDVNECSSYHTRCSPLVTCVNYPGGFQCGPCPSGYTGDGFQCQDIDECLVNNGGCSPYSICHNTVGGRRCGPCSSGFTGNGESCVPAPRPCQQSACHPLATCVENPQMPNGYQCICPLGYQGMGIGMYGCAPVSGGGQGIQPQPQPQPQPTNLCQNQPCLNGGTCVQFPGSYTYTCTCQPGYTGHSCETQIDACASNPCLNGGTCNPGLNSYTCTCSSSHTGERCQTETEQCGGFFNTAEGSVSYPGVEGVNYNHNIDCVWIISVPRGKVINVTFDHFHLEAMGCRYDWLQIHDGRRSTAPLIGRYCGQTLPGNNGTVITTHNVMYLWFRSDESHAATGFSLTWNATDPVCGSDIRDLEYGSINSPGYPGNYPHLRDCYWTIRVTPGKRIRFHFATLQIENHANCSYDFLEVRDGLTETGHLLAKYCSSQAPAPLTTSGSEAFLHFHSDISMTDTGFHIAFSSEPGIPGCGGLLTNDMGVFSVPTLDDRYQNNIRCEWLIRVPPGEVIQLNFTEFHLEGPLFGSRCRYDYVEIRDGGSVDSPIMSRWCGTNLPTATISSSNQLFVIFHADHSVTGRGFSANYRVSCGGEYSGSTGLLRSPYHPQSYPHNRECVYVISQPVGKAIKLNFTDFDIEGPLFWGGCRWDYVEIRDGRRETSPLFGRYCGPETHRPDPIISTHNYMWIKFVTDASVSNRGFVANYTTIDTSCGGIIRDLSGHINSPNSPDLFPSTTDCRWILDLPPGYGIQITWHTFALGSSSCESNYVEIFDNSSIPGMGGQMGERYCGSNMPPIMTSTSNLVTIHFHDDYTFNQDSFSAIYHGIDYSTTCGGHFHTQVGTLTSPNYPLNYPNARSCEWTITVPRNYQIRLIFNEVDIEPSSSCSYDYLEIRNGGYSTSPFLKKICSKNATVHDIVSHSFQLYLKFKTDSSMTYKGFNISWEIADSQCGGELTAVSGEFASPAYPEPYHNSALCVWKIRVAQGSSVRLRFVDLDLENAPNCIYDFVEIRDGDNERAPLLGRHCATADRFIGYNSTSNTMYISFLADHVINSRGFKAHYTAVCNRVITGPRGVITSLNYPNPYPHDQNCTWTIKVPQGNSINASFSDFVLEVSMSSETELCYYDFVELREGRDSEVARSVIGHYCRLHPPPPIATSPTMNVLEVNFVSDYIVADNGFRLEWVVNGCGGELTKATGSFNSPNYPNAYPINTDCEWNIRTAPGTRIEITVHDFDLESFGNCVFDSLKIYGGPDASSPELQTLCHRQTHPIVATTQGNQAFLSLHSDQSVRGKGFNATYRTLHDGCGGTYSAPEGTIHTPGYPNQDFINSDCQWTITVDRLHIVEFNFTDFDVQFSTNCSDEYVAVYDGTDSTGPELTRRCLDTPTTPNFVRSTGNSLTVRLVYAGTSRGRGFTASYKRGCGATVNVSMDERGDLVSPHYPHLFTSGLNCSWHLQAPDGSRVMLHIAHLDIHTRIPNVNNCSMDYVAILDGPNNRAPEQGRYCGSHTPRAIISSGRYLTVNLVTLYGFGVGFRAVYSVLTSGCGGDLSSVSGELATPHYPQPYPSPIECEWNVKAGPGNEVQLNFVEFDLENSQGCNTDYVEVHETDPAGPLLLHNCSTDLPASINAHDSLWIKFRSDEEGVGAKGFLASYSLVYGVTQRGESGEVVSPMYPHVYRGEDITWRITVPWRKVVRITFLDMDIEGNPVDDTCISSVQVYSGYYRHIGTFCGYEAPPDPIYSSWNVATVKFHTGHHNVGARFRFRYDAVDRGVYPPSSMVRQADSNCTFFMTLNESSTVIKNPGNPGYANNLNCQWVLEAPAHFRLQIYVSYELEESQTCLYDRVNIYDGVEGRQTWNLTRTLCRRSQWSEKFFKSSGRFLKLTFVTDHSISGRGFEAHISPICGGYLYGPEGVISTPNYPENYDPGLRCKWQIRVGFGRTIRLEFDSFKVTNTTPICGGDYLLIRNGDSPSSPFLGAGKFCGTATPQVTDSSSNVLSLEFVSDNSDGNKGFKLRYYETADACGGNHRLTADLTRLTVTSPNYPNSPDPHTECAWVILAPAGKAISLHFEGHFDITTLDGSCDQAYVEVRDGGTILSPLLNTACGSELPSTQHSTGNILYVRYFNNMTHHHSGFKAIAEIDTCGDTCGGTYNVLEGGVITSPNYPEAFPDNSTCTWRIVGPVGHFLSLRFLDLQLEGPEENPNCTSAMGRVVIRDNSTDGEVLAQACGTNLPSPVDTAANVAYVVFRGFDNTDQRGFKLVYNVSLEECGGEMSGPEGEIRSPGYPHGYSRNRFCVWHITVPEGRRVMVEVVDIDLATDFYEAYSFYHCRDYISMQNGPDRFSPSFYPFNLLCDTRNLDTPFFNTSMNVATVTFVSRKGFSSGRGFRLRWTSDEPQECGGQLQYPSGELSTPRQEEGRYSHGLYCVWTLDNFNSLNSSFSVSVTNLDLEARCFDYIMIEGVTTDGEIVEVQKVCNNHNMETIIVPYPTLRIKFITDFSVSAIGFNLTYGLSSCGGQVHGPQSVIHTPDYPSNYPPNTHCGWLFNYNEGEQIDFEFTDFRLENSIHHDFVKIFNGPRKTSPLMHQYTGTTNPGSVGRSMTNHLLVEFHSDATNSDRGFRAVASRHIRGCGGLFHGMSGNLSSHEFPQDYQVNSECEWVLDFTPGFHAVLTFVERFDIETSADCQNDYLQLSQTSDIGQRELSTWTQVLKACGKQMPTPLTLVGTRARIFFHANEAVQGAGFKLMWQMECGNNFTATTGVIVSPGHPGNYDNNLNCVYRILAPSGHFVRINFQSFQLEGSYNCRFDSITISDETMQWRRRRRTLGPYCGNDSPGSLTTKGQTTITFSSDFSVTYPGFMLNYTIEACGGNITAPSVIELPTRPATYLNNMHCTWDISAPEGKVPHIKFQILNLESGYNCPYDHVSIYNGHTSEDSKMISRLCGNHMSALPSLAANERLARVEFLSDSSYAREGFRANIEFTYACGGNVNISTAGATQTIRSLDADSDGNYEPFLDCRWSVVGLADNVVNLTFTRLDIEPPGENDTSPCPYDYLQIFDGPSDKSPLISTLCNSTSLPPSVASSSNVMYIRFLSDSANERAGFTATVSNIPHPCGTSALTATNHTQTIESPGYPNQYQTSILCRWTITTPEDTQDIHIEFTDMNLESSPKCTKDFVEVGYLANTGDSRITTGYTRWTIDIAGRTAYFSRPYGPDHIYCGSALPHSFDSYANSAQIRFRSDETVTAPGFRMQYSIATCNRTYSASSGYVKIHRGETCFTTFQAPVGSYVNLYFTSAYVAASENCANGALKIYDGASSSDSLLLSYCGYRLASPVFSTGNSLYMEVTAQSYLEFTYVTTNQSNGCGGSMFVSHSTKLTSPNYPSPSAENLDCMFTLMVQQSLHVYIRVFVNFGGPGQCNSTYLELYDVNADGSPVLFNTLCGDESSVAMHLAPSNKMALRYKTGPGNQTGIGWEVMIRGIEPHETTVFDDVEGEEPVTVSS
ncbi:LOW QUALITY PROTEIN: cubilin-like [Penaeus chinensis]|uniref:LOW QUALITY PROTEIN: cubilin-like n=1 Tax=Penaeus chinensis TaxID=139456 RepID=UPI001FB76CF5|nr:LOW QUALITY PROTEIN: cubilin-like [Penaeus chinensis]